MMHPEELSIADFTYVLPPDRIAQQPLQERDQSKLLVYKRHPSAAIREDLFSNLTQYIPGNTTLVFNDTKVIHARILFKNENDATIEVFLLEPVAPFHDMQLAIFQHGECTWRCLVGNMKKWREDFLSRKIKFKRKADSTLEYGTLEVRLKGSVEGDFLVHFSWNPPDLSFAKILECAGYVPLPPYIKRNTSPEDEDRYQTLYATQDGSVAAPTAGLHFSESLMKKLKQKNIHASYLTLHVSAGTFMPVKTAMIRDHAMHAEQFVIRKNTVEELLKKKDDPLIAVGTTSVRTLESLYWLGRRILKGDATLTVDQWEPYGDLNRSSQVATDSKAALLAIQHFMEEQKLNQLTGETKLIIAPGYSFKMVDALITNFHQPQSTLLLLVAAFIGDDWKKVYAYAMENNFRFLSYGDGSLLWRS